MGVEIFQKRSQLRAWDHSNSLSQPEQIEASQPRPFTGIRTTEVKVTHDTWSNSDLEIPTTPSTAYTLPDKAEKEEEKYTITISAKNGKTKKASGTFWPKRPTSMDKVKWAYFKVAMLFAVSILITWVPASINRVHGLTNPDDPSYVLNIGSAIVLPLQGFWNTVIYFTTSLTICKKVIKRLRKGTTGKEGDALRQFDVRMAPRRDLGVSDSDSLAELSGRGRAASF